jgi:hypothetical protein
LAERTLEKQQQRQLSRVALKQQPALLLLLLLV